MHGGKSTAVEQQAARQHKRGPGARLASSLGGTLCEATDIDAFPPSPSLVRFSDTRFFLYIIRLRYSYRYQMV